MPKNSQKHFSDDTRNIRDIIILAGILVGLLILAVRPFGYKAFQIGLAQRDIFPTVLIVGIVGVVLVILQRLGIIFGDQLHEK